MNIKISLILYILNMSVLSQSTIARKVTVSGIGIHTGEKVTMNILPAAPNTGIVFKRIDLDKTIL